MADLDSQTESAQPLDPAEKKEAGTKRQIPGNLPYTTAVGVLRRALEKIIESERPPNFNRDFMSTVLGVSGGASNPIIPIFKKAGLVGESGSPTELYSEFQTSGGRANAALQALRNGFPEIFKRNQYAHKAEKDKIVDIVRTITGLQKNDPIVGYIYNTFLAFQSYAKEAFDVGQAVAEIMEPDQIIETPRFINDQLKSSNAANLGLSYQINIVLPETSNVDVLNAIFRSLRENLLR